MRKIAVWIAVLAGASGVGSAQAGWDGSGDCCVACAYCGGPSLYWAPVPAYSVAVRVPTYMMRPATNGTVVGQPMLVTVPTGSRPGYVVNQGQYPKLGQYPYDLDGIGAAPIGIPVAYPGNGYGYRYGYGHRYRHHHPFR